VDEDEVHNLCLSSEAIFIFQICKKKIVTRQTVTFTSCIRNHSQGEGYSVVCDSIFWDYGPIFFQTQYEIIAVAASVFYVHMIQTFLTQNLTQFLQISENTWLTQDGTYVHKARNSLNAVNIFVIVLSTESTSFFFL
jgi:hypothetical protein